MVRVKLLKREKHWVFGMLPPISVVSFYRSSANNDDSSMIEETLIKRFKEIATANPWLCGRLVRSCSEGLCISFDEAIDNPKDYITSVEDDAFFQDTKYNSVSEFCRRFTIKPGAGRNCLLNDEHLCRLVIIQSSTKLDLALCFFLNHSIADGYTFYRIWKMLDSHEAVSSLTVERLEGFEDAVNDESNLQTLMIGKLMLGKLMLGKLGRGIGRTFTFRSRPKTFFYKVNTANVERVKAEHNTDSFFVSTNDILCTWLFKRCQDVHEMFFVVDPRSRIGTLSADMAGNYQCKLHVNMSNINNCKDFRQKWQKVLTKEDPADYNALNPNWTTSWTTFYHQVELDGFSHRIHFPVLDLSKQQNWFGIPLATEAFALIFKMNNRDVGIYLKVYGDLFTEEYFDNCEMLDEKMSF